MNIERKLVGWSSAEHEPSFQKVSVVGLGYIGLPTAAMFASRRIEVVGVDVSHTVVEQINKGKIHIVEPDLDIAVHAAVTSGYLKATMEVEPAEVFIIAVPTPFKGQFHEPDLQYVMAAAVAIAPVLQTGNLVILESTCPVGTTELLAERLAEERPDLTFPQTCGARSDIRVAHCPERVLPGKVMKELILNDRVIGGMTPKCSELAVSLYQCFVTGDCVVTDTRSAEMAKLAENGFRDVNIAFANELSMICERLEMDVWEVLRLANRHPRVDILRPGPGVGGHCIAVDPWFIAASAPEEARLIRAAREVNDSKPEWVVNKIRESILSFLSSFPEVAPEDITIACYGLSFKPDIDDLRESPAVAIVQEVSSVHPGPLLVVEPNIHSNSLSGAMELVSLEQAHKQADIHVYLVAHKEFVNSPKPMNYCIDAVGLDNGIGS